MIALSRTQGSCTRPGDVPQVWGISQWVGVWGALGLARGNLAVTHLEATYPKLLCRYLGTSCLHCMANYSSSVARSGADLCSSSPSQQLRAASSTPRLESKPTRLSCRNTRPCFLPFASLGMSI